MNVKKPELLSPAGTLRNMRYAFAYGADAVYAGMPRYSLRVRNNDFLHENLATGIAEAHAQGRQFFVAANIMPHGAKLATFLDDIRPVVEMGPDAFIMADPGLIMKVREAWPDLPVHLSVQANTMNAWSVDFWKRLGLTRVILSRELSLDEIEEIRQACPDMEIEVFVHGALCIAYSGRCLLSGYFNHRDANQGTCTNACRWEYKMNEAPSVSVEDMGRHPRADQVYYIEEPNRPGEFMPIEEDEHGTYIMNSRDLRAVEHVQRLVDIGVDCLKIEGRTKSHYYTAQVTQIYRQAIDDAVAGKPFDISLMAALESLANRGYTDGFFQRHETHEMQNYRQGASLASRSQFVAEVLEQEEGWALVEVKNRFQLGDELTLVTPSGNMAFDLTQMQDRDGKPLETAPGSGWQVRIPLPQSAGEYALLTRTLT
ncbi:tRNA 5-hydroxyuridine modification protein YegQ [Thiolapillus sp.]|uniref:prephenate-dependent tRNA uridine(34) hydroxylase TrhP n=4 Tax=Thiolapillus sp. TaxID=2017437 RepID=UPI0025FDBD78|nr:tRNA 5-hydroxyuridine modification protein YegQ [Thiolapillus sp.]